MGPIYTGLLDGVPVAVKCLGHPPRQQLAASPSDDPGSSHDPSRSCGGRGSSSIGGSSSGGSGCGSGGGSDSGGSSGCSSSGSDDLLEQIGGTRRFRRAAQALAAAHHPHLLMLLGSCPQHGMLVTEVAEGGSFQARLFGLQQRQHQPLAWQVGT